MYSSEEQIIGKWHGKTLYRKVLTPNLAGSKTIEITHNIEGIDRIVNMYGALVAKNGVFSMIPKVTSRGDTGTSINIYASKEKVVVDSNVTMDYANADIVLEYTKL